jgi:hypothetical protein
MIELQEFRQLVARIAAVAGISEDLASDYAVLIGDIHQFDENGNVMVIDEQGRHIATLPAAVLPDDE